MARPAPPRPSRPPRAVWPHLFRAVMWKPVLLGGAGAIGLAYDGFKGPEQTLAASAMAIGCSFALDDPATTTLANSPSPLWWRRTLHLVLVLPLAAAMWLVTMGVTGIPAGAAPPAHLEVGALVVVVLAASAAAARQRGDGLGGAAGAPCLLGLLAVATLVPSRWALYPVVTHQWRWVLLLSGALLALLAASRDPAARDFPFRNRLRPRTIGEHTQYGVPTKGAAMKVEAILKVKGRHVETIEPDARMSTAVHRLATLGIGALIVTRDGDHVEGIVAEREVVRGLSRHGAAMLDLHVSALMNRAVPACSPEDTVKHVMGEMTRTRNRHLPVVVGGRLAGLVSLGDVVKNRVEEMEMEVAIRRDTYIARR